MENTLIKLKETRESAEADLKQLIARRKEIDKEISLTEKFIGSLPSADGLVMGEMKPKVNRGRKAKPKSKDLAQPKAKVEVKSGPRKIKRGALRAAITSFASDPRTKTEIVEHVTKAGVLNMDSKNPVNSVNQVIYGKGFKRDGDRFTYTG